MFVRLTSKSITEPCWIAVDKVQAVTKNHEGGSRVRLTDCWVYVSEEPDDVVRMIERDAVERSIE